MAETSVVSSHSSPHPDGRVRNGGRQGPPAGGMRCGGPKEQEWPQNPLKTAQSLLCPQLLLSCLDVDQSPPCSTPIPCLGKKEVCRRAGLGVHGTGSAGPPKLTGAAEFPCLPPEPNLPLAPRRAGWWGRGWVARQGSPCPGAGSALRAETQGPCYQLPLAAN